MSYSDLDNFEYKPEETEIVNVTRPRVVGRRHNIGSFNSTDRVNSPSHYTRGRTEAIDVIEDSIKDAPSPIEGMLQAQVLKYVLRLWLKDNPQEDAEKARWYLNRLIDKLS